MKGEGGCIGGGADVPHMQRTPSQCLLHSTPGHPCCFTMPTSPWLHPTHQHQASPPPLLHTPQATQYSHGFIGVLVISASHPAHAHLDFTLAETHHHSTSPPPKTPLPPPPR
jgi:hypothetical protein